MTTPPWWREKVMAYYYHSGNIETENVKIPTIHRTEKSETYVNKVKRANFHFLK